MNKIIVSLTSYPGRIHGVSKVIKTLMIQTKMPDKIILWLSKVEFPNLEYDLPEDLLELRKYGLIITWVEEDLKPHKKYFYAMQIYSEDIIITVDDDIFYSPMLVECLLDSYLRHPHAISCTRVNLMLRDQQNQLLDYDKWIKNHALIEDVEVMDYLAVGCGGVLYPPKIFSLTKLCDKKAIYENCLFQDDLWLKVNEVLQGIPIVLAKNSKKIPLVVVDEMQKNGLHEGINIEGNDIALKALKKYVTMQKGEKIEYFIYNSTRAVIIEEMLKKCKLNNILEQTDSKKIYIYGAGEGAKTTYITLLLLAKAEYVGGFVVTNIKENPKKFFGLPVMEIDELTDKNELIIVSTANRTQQEITELLKEKGYKYIVVVNNQVICELNRLILRMKDFAGDLIYLK